MIKSDNDVMYLIFKMYILILKSMYIYVTSCCPLYATCTVLEGKLTILSRQLYQY